MGVVGEGWRGVGRWRTGELGGEVGWGWELVLGCR